jgi:alanine dehydrogenase
MNIGLPKEIKIEEFRVALTPETAHMYVKHGHRVSVEAGAGIGSGIPDADYAEAGCSIESDRPRLFREAEMIVKVKEPLPSEYPLFRRGQILFTYLHLAADRRLTDALLASGIIGIAYETVQEADHSLPLLVPMSQVAGRLAVQEGAKYLEKTFGGRGVLLGGVPGVNKGKVVILGGGVAGTNACKIALGMGAEVTILDISTRRLAELDDLFGSRAQTLYASPHNIELALREADLVIGAVLIPGAAAPKLVLRRHLKTMKPGAVIVDIAVDQGGCFETTRPTTHANPVFIEEGIVHYCVANMPGAVSRTSTLALTNATIRYGLQLADQGVEKALASSPALRAGLNCHTGRLTHAGVAAAHGLTLAVWP